MSRLETRLWLGLRLRWRQRWLRWWRSNAFDGPPSCQLGRVGCSPHGPVTAHRLRRGREDAAPAPHLVLHPESDAEVAGGGAAPRERPVNVEERGRVRTWIGRRE